MGSKPKSAVKKAAVKDSGPQYNPILSTNGGHHAYVCQANRKTPLFATNSTEFADAIMREGFLSFVEELAERSEAWATPLAYLQSMLVETEARLAAAEA